MKKPTYFNENAQVYFKRNSDELAHCFRKGKHVDSRYYSLSYEILIF